MQHSTLIRAELEDAVAGLTPAARAVFEDIKGIDEDAGSELPEGFNALTPSERTSVIGAAKLLHELAEAEEAEEAEDLKRSEDISRLRRRLRIVSGLISLAFLIVLCGMWVDVYTEPPTPDLADTVVTTPDEVTRYLEAYVPAHESGDEPPVFIPTGLYNWNIQQSFFSYRANRYNANFGIHGYVADQMQPELYYNISMKRHLLSALVSRMIVPIVILIQLFVIVIVIGRDSKRLELFGVRPGAIIFTCAAFFFAVLVAQNSLRTELKATGFVYLESLYLLTYLVILAVAINSVLLVAQPNLRLFRDYDNIWAEVAYWPTILLTMIVITFLTFR